jgi:hypothetical protein
MMVFGWFDARVAKDRGAELARAFASRVPVEANLGERKFESRAKSAIAQLQRDAAEFARNEKLNAYKKAQLGNAFKWALKDAGYADEYVDKLTDLLLLQL